MDGGRSVPDGARGGVRSSEVGAQSADADGSLPAEADERFMARAVELARRGAGWTSPNPLVGAVIVRDGRIIGEGWHHRFGGPHAEREALAACSESPAGATAYVTLEPCCHTGKTPPCTEALIEAGIARVVVGVLDPNPLVAGRGNEALRRAGIEVAVGVLEPSCRAVNEPFLHAMEQRRPLVIAKYAMTLDGKVATREGLSRWVTGEAARRRVHEDRHRHAGVMVGIGTALADDPLLTCRLDGREVSQPARVVVDAAARLPLESQLVRTASEAPVIVAVAEGAFSQEEAKMKRKEWTAQRAAAGYTTATARALEAAEVVTVRSVVELEVTVDYSLYERTALLIQAAGAKLADPQFTDRVTLRWQMPEGTELPLLEQLRELTRGGAQVSISQPFYAPF